MGLGARGTWAVVALGIMLVLALFKIAADSEDSTGSSLTKDIIHSGNFKTNLTGSIPPLPASDNTVTPSNAVSLKSANRTSTTVKPSTTPASSKNGTSTTKKSIEPSTRSSTTTVSSVSKNGTTTTVKPVTSKMTSTLKPTTKKTSVSPTTSQTSTSVTTTHNSSVTSVSSSVTIPSTINSKDSKSSKFDTGSFVGGIVLTLGVVLILYFGCRVYYARRGIQYRTIDEHDAII